MFSLANNYSRRDFLRAFAAACAAGTMAGCASSQPQSSDADQDGSQTKEFDLTVALGAQPTGLDPVLCMDYDAVQVMGQIYEGLLRFEEGSCEVLPCLAELPQVSDDGLTYTFPIRQGVVFHDGTELDAQVVKENLERQIEPNRTDAMIFSAFAFGSTATGDGIESVEAKDKSTLVIKLRAVSASFLSNLAMCVLAPIVSPKSFDTANEHPVGTGPYAFESWDKGKGIVLRRFDSYWDEERSGRAQGIVFGIFDDLSARKACLVDRKSDVTLFAQNDLLAESGSEGYEIVDVPVTNLSYLAFNTASEPFKNKEARVAFAQAIDVPTLVVSLYGDNAEYASSAYPFGEATSSVVQAAYDKDAARSKLAELGVKTVRCLAYEEPQLFNGRGGEALATALQRYAESAGVAMDIVTCMSSDYASRLDSGEYDVCLAGWRSMNGGPSGLFRLLVEQDPTLNISRFADNTYKELVRKADEEMREGVRGDFYLQCDRFIADQQIWLPLSRSRVKCAHRANVQGVVFHPTGVAYLHDATKGRQEA